MHLMLYQQSERYRQLSAPLGGDQRDVRGEHQALVDAVLGKDVQAAQALIVEHLQTTGRLLVEGLRAQAPKAAKRRA